jgi:mono/diheme cytochrome c family protein
MRNRLGPIAACLGVGLSAGLLALGCGGGNGSDTVEQHTSSTGAPLGGAVEQPLSQAQQHGQQLFVARCGSCHTFHAAGTVGQIGPDLDDIAIDEAAVFHAIRTGGGSHSHGAGGKTGNMPRNLVTGKDRQDVVAFVAANASGSSTP